LEARGWLQLNPASRVEVTLYLVQGENPMRTIAYALALALGVAFATSASAGDVTMAKTKADCDKAGGMWDTATSTCKAKQ
jgi:hypothetical protein